MATIREPTAGARAYSAPYSVARSLVSHYWMFTVVVLSFVVWGAVLAPTMDWEHLTLLLVAVYLGLEGLHDIDLSDPDVAVDINPRIQWSVGYLMVAAGTLIGIYLAFQTTLAFAAIAVLELFLGLAYNEEWFGGYLHDLDQFGWFNFALSWGFIPVVAGYYLMSGGLSLAVMTAGLAAFGFSLAIIYCFEVSKVPTLYESIGVSHDRDYELSQSESYEYINAAILGIVVGVVSVAATLALAFGF